MLYAVFKFILPVIKLFTVESLTSTSLAHIFFKASDISKNSDIGFHDCSFVFGDQDESAPSPSVLVTSRTAGTLVTESSAPGLS